MRSRRSRFSPVVPTSGRRSSVGRFRALPDTPDLQTPSRTRPCVAPWSAHLAFDRPCSRGHGRISCPDYGTTKQDGASPAFAGVARASQNLPVLKRERRMPSTTTPMGAVGCTISGKLGSKMEIPVGRCREGGNGVYTSRCSSKLCSLLFSPYLPVPLPTISPWRFLHTTKRFWSSNNRSTPRRKRRREQQKRKPLAAHWSYAPV